MKTEKLLKLMNSLAWVVFIGLLITTGAVIVSYIVSIGNEQAAKNMYKGLDLSAYRHLGLLQYTFIVGYRVILFITEAYIAFLMTDLLSRLNISRPFNADVVKLMQKISYAIFYVWIIALVNNIHAGLLEKIYGVAAIYIPVDSIFLAGIVYILTQMFKRGIEIQSENELTI